MVVFVFAGYPIVTWLLSRLVVRPVDKAPTEPAVTIVIAAYNEAENIEATIRNKLEQDYPPDKLDILVVSDASNDGTDDIVAAFGSRVRLLRQEARAGKTAALNLAVREATGDVIVFSDANSLYDPSAVRLLIRNFHDESVGYATGRMVYVDADGSIIGDGCSAYMRYEHWIRTWESRLGSVVGVDGGLDACRRQLYRPMRDDQLPDFVLPLSVVENGYRVVYEPEALLREESLSSSSDEYRMRVRVATRALWALWDKRHLMNPFRYGHFAFQLATHKLLRYLAFVFLIVALLLNLALLNEGPVYVLTMALQVGLYVLAGIGSLPLFKSPPTFLALPHFFVLLNVANAHALIKVLAGKKVTVWAPRTG